MDICRRDKIEKISSDKLQAQLKIQYENFEDTPNQSRIEFLETLINNYNKGELQTHTGMEKIHIQSHYL